MGSTKRVSNEPLTIEIGGRVFHGHRTVEGTRKLFQTVWYGDVSKSDGHSYRPGEEVLMKSIAHTILRELVQEQGDLESSEAET